MAVNRKIRFHHAGDFTGDNVEQEFENFAEQVVTRVDLEVKGAAMFPQAKDLQSFGEGQRKLVQDAAGLYWIVERIGNVLYKVEVTPI
jgi:hypothetical protein